MPVLIAAGKSAPMQLGVTSECTPKRSKRTFPGLRLLGRPAMHHCSLSSVGDLCRHYANNVSPSEHIHVSSQRQVSMLERIMNNASCSQHSLLEGLHTIRSCLCPGIKDSREGHAFLHDRMTCMIASVYPSLCHNLKSLASENDLFAYTSPHALGQHVG